MSRLLHPILTFRPCTTTWILALPLGVYFQEFCMRSCVPAYEMQWWSVQYPKSTSACENAIQCNEIIAQAQKLRSPHLCCKRDLQVHYVAGTLKMFLFRRSFIQEGSCLVIMWETAAPGMHDLCDVTKKRPKPAIACVSQHYICHCTPINGKGFGAISTAKEKISEMPGRCDNDVELGSQDLCSMCWWQGWAKSSAAACNADLQSFSPSCGYDDHHVLFAL